MASSEEPLRDLVNVALHGVQLRLEMMMTNRLRHAANAVLAVFMVLLGYVVNDLESGITDVHRHGWSTLAVGLVALGAAARVAALDLLVEPVVVPAEPAADQGGIA
jgi:hypothetical protein